LSALPQVDVCLAYPLIDTRDLSGKTVVVIDILRATSNINAALHFGAEKVFTVSEISEMDAFDKDEHLFAAERNGQKLEGFTFGNSPQQWKDGAAQGKKIVLSTTNGTRCVTASLSATTIIAGAFCNLAALVKYLVADQKDVILFCAGWKKRSSLEDLYFAGAVVDALDGEFELAYDSAILAKETYLHHKEDLVGAIKKSHYYTRISTESLGTDLEYCLQFDTHNFVALFEEGGFVKRLQ